ncbi:hypothetical protein BH11CYA1_BH11CYA1_28990 [soil metagenome]
MFNTATGQSSHKLHIPAGIRFECTRCANCCLSWPVPLNEGDVKRLTDALQCAESDLPVSLLSSAERQAGLVGFSRALEKRPDGRCSYLNDTACSLQDLAKPAMCQLFPYSFIDTPDGTFVGLSFASTGVLHNSGRLLQEQSEQLEGVLKLFRELFPTLQNETTEAFDHLRLAEGITLTFEQFKSIEAPLLSELELFSSNSSTGTALDILGSFSHTISQLVPKEQWRSRLPGTEARPRQIDFYILDALAQAYLDQQAKQQLLDEMQIAQAVSGNLMSPPPGFKLKLRGASYSAVQFLENKLGALDQASENLLLRFLYVRIFSKMYFGPGFSGLSLIAGIGHLTSVIVLIRLAAKARKISASISGVDNQEENLLWLVETIRQIDSKLTSARYGANTRAMLEILFLDSERVQRLIDLAA